MKKVDIVRLRLKGVSNEEIKELIELEALAEDEAPDDKKEDDTPDEAPDDKEEPSSGIEEAKKEIEELKKKLAAAQKANSQKDVSGAAASKDTDQDIFNKAVASFM